MAEKVKKAIPEELEAFLKEVQENISLYPETIVFNRIKDYLADLPAKQVAWLTSTILITTEFRLRIFKVRCDAGDRLACEMLALAVDGDPYSKNMTVRKGLTGLWLDDNDVEAGKLLVELGKITQQELNKSIRTGKDQETIGGKTREQILCELAAEARGYGTADAFSMAMIMGRLKSVPQPNTANVLKIIKGKYSSGEEFWNGVKKGEICAEKENPPPSPKEKEARKPEPVMAPLEPVIPVPEKSGGKAPELDLMKKEIQDRIAKMKAEKGRGELKAGEKELTPVERREIARAIVATSVQPVPSTGAMHVVCRDFVSQEMKCRGCTFRFVVTKCIHRPEFKVRESDIKNRIREGQETEIGWSKSFTEFKDLVEIVKNTDDLKQLKDLYNKVDAVSALIPYHNYEIKAFIIERMQNIVEYYEKHEKKPVFPEQFRERENNRDEDVMHEPRDYTQWTFADFEGLIQGLEDIDDLEELYEYIGASDKISQDDEITLRNLVKQRIQELREGYEQLSKIGG